MIITHPFVSFLLSFLSGFLLEGASSFFSEIAKGTKYAGFSGHSFRMFEIKLFCFVVAISDLEHDAEAIQGLCLWLTQSSGNLF